MESDERFWSARLKVARAFSGMTTTELGAHIGAASAYITQMETGVRQPSATMAAALGAALGVEPAFFYSPLRTEFREDECFFRRRQTTPLATRTRLLAHGTFFGLVVDLLDEELELPADTVPTLQAVHPDEIERAAEKCRMVWGLGLDTPITSVVRVLENAGVVTTRFEGSTEHVDAFSRRGERAVVVLNSDKGSSSRSRFDAAHELGHLVMHGEVDIGGTEIEAQADRFASAFLLPRAGFVRDFPRESRLRWDVILNMKAHWGASMAAIIRRAYDLQLIDAAAYQRAYKYMSAQGWRKGEPGEVMAEIPELVPIALKELEAATGETLLGVARRLRWSPSTFERVTGVSSSPRSPSPDTHPGGRVVSLANARALRAS